MTRPVRELTFRPEHALESILYVLEVLGPVDVHSVLKAVYFADLHHIEHYGGLTASGDEVRAQVWGPAPEGTYNLLQAADGRQNEYIPERFHELVAGALQVTRYPHGVTALRPPNLDLLSRAAQLSLDDGAEKVRGTSFGQRVDASHDSAWAAARERFRQTGRMTMRMEEMIGTLPDAEAILEHVYGD